MKVTTLETVAGRIVEETLGVVRGSVLWSRGLKKFSRGGIRAVEYMTKEDVMEGLNQARIDAEEAAQRQAKLLGADAIIGLRIEVVELAGGMFQASAMGNAVKTSALPSVVPAFGRRMKTTAPACPAPSGRNCSRRWAIRPIFLIRCGPAYRA